MRISIAYIALVIGALTLSSCSQPTSGPKGEQGPPGPQNLGTYSSRERDFITCGAAAYGK
jgi:hypothetical protein